MLFYTNIAKCDISIFALRMASKIVWAAFGLEFELQLEFEHQLAFELQLEFV